MLGSVLVPKPINTFITTVICPKIDTVCTGYRIYSTKVYVKYRETTTSRAGGGGADAIEREKVTKKEYKRIKY
jgi:hypothetical protein